MKKLSQLATIVVALALISFVSSGAFADAPAAQTGTISGTVMTPDGKPASGVTVKLLAKNSAGKGNSDKTDKPDNAQKPDKTAKLAGGKKAAQTALKETTTNDKGEFTFSDVPAGSYIVSASQRRVGSAKGNVELKGSSAKVDLTLKARASKKNAAK
jgi:hypothetical protein